MRRHLYTNKSLTLIDPRLVHRAPKKCSPNVGERKLQASGMGLAHRDNGRKREIRTVMPGEELDGGLRLKGEKGSSVQDNNAFAEMRTTRA